MPIFKKSFSKEQKRQIILRWLASFVVTATVVVTVVVTNQEPVTADFIEALSIGNEIIYRIKVEDPSNRIADDTLRLEIKGNTEKYDILIPTGESYGSQTVLSGLGTYNMSLTANLGFGKKVLGATSVEVTGVLSGAITNYVIDTDFDLEQEPEALTYLVDTKYYDPDGLITSIWLEYGFAIENSTSAASAKRDNGEIYYQSVQVDGQDATTIVENVPNYNSEVHMRLIAYLDGHELPITLDEIMFFTPYRFILSTYTYDVGNDYAEFIVYRDSGRQIDMEVWLDIYQNGNLFASKEVSLEETFESYNASSVRIDGLTSETIYSAVFRGKYINPDTEEETMSETPSIDFSTLPYYHWEVVSFNETSSSYEISFDVDDPSHVITTPSAMLVTKNEDGSDAEYFFYQFSSTNDGDRTIYSTTIMKPSTSHYELTISLYKNYGEAYYSEIIYTLIV
ncbi:MAG: hypothetical protein EOM77_00035 [Bacteroidia bacterium]|nr:hypothetical protein [Bacteroidia bacterium]